MKFDDVKKLHQKKYRQEFEHFLLEGEHLVLELEKAAAQNNALNDSELWITEQYANWKTNFKTHIISEKQMAQISDTKTPQGIIATVPFCSFLENRSLTKPERCFYLYEIQDPGNLGTILRTLAWFGNARCLLSSNSVDPYNPKVIRSSMGAIFHTPIELDVELTDIQKRFSSIACLDMNGENIHSPDFRNFDCYVFGNEARGVPRETLASINAKPFTIHGTGNIESLNLATAVNICAYELNR